MKVKILDDCAAGGEHFESGAIAELPDNLAIALIKFKRAVAYEEKVILHREPTIIHRDPIPLVVKKGKKKD